MSTPPDPTDLRDTAEELYAEVGDIAMTLDAREGEGQARPRQALDGCRGG
jgi:hypothetical protein